ncbi:DUF3786 domain-containing protein [Candidatus Bipolaricaulota bacterium]|nr:DUF3786 domain-containing protein [Candidatus Bipolaricaulota bacterium]
MSYRDLPNGSFYSTHFKKNTEIRLTQFFQVARDRFEEVATSLEGEEISLGDSG